jgi:hypothetical protein
VEAGKVRTQPGVLSKGIWQICWPAFCDDDCPHCGARVPYDSEDLTLVIEQEGTEFVELESAETAEHEPNYRELGRFATEQRAQEFLDAGED